jgi:translocation and assembly module TamB
MKLKLPRLRWLLLLLLGPPTLIGVVLGVAITWVNTPSGLDWLRRTLVEQASAPGEMEIGIESLEGSLWSDLRLKGLTLADAQGIWLSLDEARLAWSPAALLQRRLAVAALEGGRLAIKRAPLAGSEQETTPSKAFSPPTIPLQIRVERLSVDEIALGEALAGEAARLSLEGRLGAEESGLLTSALDLKQLDGAFLLSLQARYQLDEELLDAKLTASDASGGLVARLAGDPTLPALSLELEGEAPLWEWKGRIAASAQGMASLAGDIGISLEPAPRLTYRGKATLPLLADVPAAAVLAEESDLDLALSLPDDQTLRVERFGLESEALSASLSGSLGFDGLEGAFDLSLDLRDATAIAALAPGIEVSDLTLEARQEGKLLQPQVSGEARVSGLKVEQGPSFSALDMTFGVEPGEGQVWRLSLEAKGEGFGLAGDPQVAELARRIAGASPRLEAALAYDLESERLEVEAALLEGDLAKAQTQGRIDLPAERAELTLSLDLADLAPFSGLAGRPLSGGLHLEGEASLPLDASSASGKLSLTSQGLDLAEPLAASLLGDIDLKTGFDYGAGGLALKGLALTGKEVTLTGNPTLGPGFEALGGDYALILSNLALLEPQIGAAIQGEAKLEGSLQGSVTAPGSAFRATLPGLTLEGALSLAEGAALPEGEVRARLEDPVPYAALTGLAGLEARADMTVALQTREGSPAADLSGTVTDLSLPEATRVEKITLSGRADDLLGALRFQATARAEGARASEVTLSRLDVSAQGSLTALTFGLKGQGALQLTGESRDLALDFKGSAKGLDAAKKTLRLEEGGELLLGGHRMALSQPLDLTLEGEDLTLSAPDLALDDGQLSLRYARAAQQGSLEAAFSDLPFTLADLAAASPPEGTVSGEVVLSGGRSAKGEISLRTSRLALSGDEDIPPLATEVAARFTGKQLEAQVTAKGAVKEPLQATLVLPMTLDLVTPGFTLPQNAPISGQARWNSKLAPLAALFAPPNLKMTGNLALDARLSGTLDNPRMEGEAVLSGGTLEHLEQGTYFANLTLETRFNGETLNIERFSADDSLGGSFSGEGEIGLEPDRGFPLTYGMEFKNLRVVTRDEATANISGTVKANGSLRGMDLVARLKTEEVNISLANELPPEVVDLEPIPVDQVSEGEEEQRQPPAVANNIRLDVVVDIPNRLFVRGRGLSSEWQGAVLVKGTAAAPAISGELTILRGDVEILAKRFVFKEGTIRLPERPGSPPVLDILAVHDKPSLQAQVRITGPSDNIEIKLSSLPPLPEDEILARVLFDKSAGQLSAIEALQLAGAIAQLTGKTSGPGILERARAAIGVDVLRVDGGDGSSGPSVEAGRYLTKDVYVGVEQGADPQSSGVAVELELNDNISIESKLKQSGGSNIGVMFEWDY